MTLATALFIGVVGVSCFLVGMMTGIWAERRFNGGR